MKPCSLEPVKNKLAEKRDNESRKQFDIFIVFFFKTIVFSDCRESQKANGKTLRKYNLFKRRFFEKELII